jgi:Holliday junction resolvase RusA-like endonuclease
MNQLFSARHNFAVDAFGCSFTVFGKAEPGGSKTAAPGTKFGVRDSNPEVKGWKQEIGIVAGVLMKGRDPYAGPLALYAKFYSQRPKGHSGRHGVKSSAPKFPVVKPDTTKLLRPLEDALTGIVWGDDAQIVKQYAEKKYCATGEEARVEVEVRVLL